MIEGVCTLLTWIILDRRRIPSIRLTIVFGLGSIFDLRECSVAEDCSKTLENSEFQKSLAPAPITGVGKCPNVSHHPTIGDIISNRYLKVMFKIPKGTFTNP